MDQFVIPECFVDTNLIETLVPPVRQYNHQKGCGTVTKVMKERFADRFALGIIDKDKKQVEYLKEFEEICKTGSLILHKHKQRPHYIIQIYPAIERFILGCAAELKVNLEDFGLDSDIERLKKRSKTVTSKNDGDFKRLFRYLQQHGAREIGTLTSWIQYLKEKLYDSKIEELRQL